MAGIQYVAPDGTPADLERYPVLGARLYDVEELALDPRNAKIHDQASVDVVKASLKKYGQRKNIVVRDGVVKAGNGTLEAARQLGWKWIVGGPAPLREVDARGYALVDNRSAELSRWNEPILKEEVAFLADAPGYGIDGLGELGFFHNEVEGYIRGPESLDGQYTRKIIPPIYEPKGDRPEVSELFDDEKSRALVGEIDAKKLPAEVAAFLRLAAQRHTVFNFHRIAEFYAHADAKTQRLFEKSALVIIDFDKAIENGFVRLTERLGKIADGEGWKEK